MKKQTVVRILSAMLVFCMLFLTACGTANKANDNGASNPGTTVQGGTTTEQGGGNSTVTNPSDDSNSNEPAGDYREGVVLVKYSGEMNDNVIS